MNAAPSAPHADRDVLKRAAAEAAVQLVENDMIVGLGSGSTAAFAVESSRGAIGKACAVSAFPPRSGRRRRPQRRTFRSQHLASIGRSISRSTALMRSSAARSI
jgi:hypothetical protein